MKNRSRMEILYHIVSAAKSPVKKTNLMYKSNLSFKQLELYLDFLVGQGLIEGRPDGQGYIYGATSKGFQFTNVFEDLQSYLSPSNPLPTMNVSVKPRENEIEPFTLPEIQMSQT